MVVKGSKSGKKTLLPFFFELWSNLMEALTKSLELAKKPKTPVKRAPKSKKKEAYWRIISR